MTDGTEMPAGPANPPQAPQTQQAMPKPAGKIDVKIILGAILVIAAVALAFIYFTQGQAGTGQNTPAPVANTTPAPIPAPQNNTSGSIAINISVNETPAAPKPPADPFANITPRNISDRIADGQFRITENPAAPLNVYVISDGYADSILVNKGEFFMLVDAGNFSPADALLQKLGVSHLNVVVATRDYEGAIGGIGSLLSSYKVDEIWDNNVPPEQGSAYAGLLSQAAGRGITAKHPEAGDGMNVSGLSVSVLNPQKERLLGNPDLDSVVLKLSSGGFCMLLLNPTVQERENAIIAGGQDLRCDVVTYFKHGEGRPEPSLLISNAAKPKDAIISVGPNGDGLPSNTTLERLGLGGIRVWRTDKNGTIAVSNDGVGSGYTISKYASGS